MFLYVFYDIGIRYGLLDKIIKIKKYKYINEYKFI
jgi:hypothetical protein